MPAIEATDNKQRGAGPVRLFLTVVVLGLLAALPAGAAGPADEALQGFIDREMPASGVPGLAYAVVDDGEIAAVGARGVADVRGDTEVTPDTPFLTGSISKSFTALAVMQLVEAGKVDLDTHVSQYLDGLAGRPVGEITIRQLLSHTSGFSTLQGNDSHTDATGGSDELAARVNALVQVDPAYEPGERWEYSNTNYAILGRLIEVVSGREFQAYVSANILKPVGMNDSFVADGKIHDSMATGHRPWFGTNRPLADNSTHRGTAPQGGIVASVRDLALYMAMMMNGENDVLSAGGKEQMMNPAGALSSFYGFGWYVDSDNGRVSHSGLSPGYESLLTMVPAEQKGVVVLVNANSGIGFGETAHIRNGITAWALGLKYDGEGSRWPQKALFISLVLLPILYLISMLWAWRHRDEIHAKSGPSGLFSLWFPLVTTVAAAWVILWLVPTLIGSPIGNLVLFQPDLGFVMIATAVAGVVWAVFRLGVAYTGNTAQSDR